MRVVVTRPAGDAHAWLDALQAAGHPVLALPLIEVGPTADHAPLLEAWSQGLQGPQESAYQAVMFVSAQAVRYFFAHRPASVPVLFAPRCWATGPGTFKALLQAGVPEAKLDRPAPDAAQFDSEALWQQVSGQVKPGDRVLIVRGLDVTDPAEKSDSADARHDLSPTGTGRDWLAQQLIAAGARPHFVVAYERRAPRWTAEQMTQARLAAADGSVWCFSSSQAISHLARALPSQSWRHARCITTHPRIAQSARALGFGEVHPAHPLLEDVLRSLESLA